jgi:hypothetical protein
MSDLTCRQCGAALHEGKTCAELLFELICAGSAVDERTCLEAAARYALKHPGTHSRECLELARGYLGAQQTVVPARESPDAVSHPPRNGDSQAGACVLRSFARRIFQRLGRRALHRLH